MLQIHRILRAQKIGWTLVSGHTWSTQFSVASERNSERVVAKRTWF